MHRLFDAANGVLFSGEAILDGALYDRLPCSNTAAYRATMPRLLALDVSVVHAGHGPSFGRERMREIAQNYVDRTQP